MRRSILLAICDFLILSALSLSSGVTQYHKPAEHADVVSDGASTKLVPDKSWKSEFKVTGEQIRLYKAQKEIERLAASESRLKDEQSKAKQELLSREENIKALESINREIQDKNKDLVKKIEHDKSLIRNIDTIVQDLSTKNKELSTDLTKKAFRIDNLCKINSNLSRLNKQMKENINAKEKQVSVLEERTKTLKASFKELESVIADKDKTIQQVKKATDEVMKNNERLVESVEQHRMRLAQVEEQKKQLEDKRIELEKSLNNVKLEVLKEEQKRKHELLIKDVKLSDALDELKRLKLKLAKLSQGNGFVWEKYSGSSVKLDVKIVTVSEGKQRTMTSKGYIPEVEIDGDSYLLGEFSSLGFNWDRIVRNKVSELDILIGGKNKVEGPVKCLIKNPSICFIPIKSGLSKNSVKAIGYDALLKRGLDDIYLFKRNGNSSELKCYFSPAEPGYVFTKNAHSSSTTLSASPGDFLFTKKGRLIGVFVTHSKCYILPLELKKEQLSNIPVSKNKNEKYYIDFTKAIKKIRG